MGGFERYMPGPLVFELTHEEPGCMTANAVAPEIEALVREHSRLVFRIAYSVVRNHDDAEDVVQEVFLRVAKHGVVGIKDTKAWISRIAWRASVDRYRQADRKNQEEFDERLHASPIHLSATEQDAISREMMALLDRLIAALPKKEQDALLLTSVEGLSSAEAAKVLGTTETSIRGRVFRARQKLAEKLQNITGTKYGR